MSTPEEAAKAVQEVAKTTGQAIGAAEKVGGFLAPLLHESLEVGVGMVSDKLKFMRWERQIRMMDRTRQILKERGIDISKSKLTAKLAIPILENASLEENDELQDIWARLLASAVDGKQTQPVRSAFIDIAKQLEVRDVAILNAIYERFNEMLKTGSMPMNVQGGWITSADFHIRRKDVDGFPLLEGVYEEVMDNLFRLRLCAPAIVNEDYTIADSGAPAKRYLSTIFQYDPFCITPLGRTFVKACIAERKSA